VDVKCWEIWKRSVDYDHADAKTLLEPRNAKTQKLFGDVPEVFG
jgi:hypothetical protein